MNAFVNHLNRIYFKSRKFKKFPGQTGLQYLFKLKRKFVKKGEFIFISSLPKSASTFLLLSLVEITGFRETQLCQAYERHEQNLNLLRLFDAYRQNTVTRHHTKATGPNLEMMRIMDIRSVILVRNIFDIVPSIHDYLFKEGFEKFPAFY